MSLVLFLSKLENNKSADNCEAQIILSTTVAMVIDPTSYITKSRSLI